MAENELRLQLTAVEARVLGALVEKQIATPDYYPLTLNALTLACNQTSNRDPVVAFDEHTVARAIESLREKKLAFMFGGAQARVPRYGHKLDEAWTLQRAELAALCVLVLRGPQTTGEVKGRSGRLHEFGSLEEAETALECLVNRPEGALAAKLARQAGFKEQRYAHVLCGAPAEQTVAAESGPPPEPATIAVRAENERIARLESDLAALRAEMAVLQAQFADFKRLLE